MSLSKHFSRLRNLIEGDRGRTPSRRRQRLRRLLIEQMEERRVLTTIDLATWTFEQGRIIYGAAGSDLSGFSVSSAGDFNGDGFEDALIGAFTADGQNNTRGSAGNSYVVFGSNPRPPGDIELANLGTGGVTIFGAAPADRSGRSVSSAGDINGDGFADLLIGAYFADGPSDSRLYSGDSYVIFGSATPPATIDLANLGNAGITIFGAETQDRSGISVSNAGDVNGDGFDDVLIGASAAAASGNAKPGAGETYLLFGAASMPTTIDLASLGTSGVKIFGADSNDASGYSVNTAGDVNGDGFDDILIGAINADALGNSTSNAGDSYLVFGGPSLPSTIDLANLGTAGVTIFGEVFGGRAGVSVSSAGDVNGDGLDDLIIGGNRAGAATEFQRPYSGISYVIYGTTSFPSTISLLTITSLGMRIIGGGTNDQSGYSVSRAGDVNGDGFDDLLIGAPYADAVGNAKSNAGESYVIFGGN